MRPFTASRRTTTTRGTQQQKQAPPPEEKSIEIYSVRSIVRKPFGGGGTGKCEFIAPHSVEAWIGGECENDDYDDENVNHGNNNTNGVGNTNNKSDEKQKNAVQVFYFQPSRCTCFHCMLSERLELPVLHPGRQCMDG